MPAESIQHVLRCQTLMVPRNRKQQLEGCGGTEDSLILKIIVFGGAPLKDLSYLVFVSIYGGLCWRSRKPKAENR